MDTIDFSNEHDTKLFAMYYTEAHDRLNTSEKKQILDFIEESSHDQVLNLLTTGQMITNLDEKIDIPVSPSEIARRYRTIKHYQGATTANIQAAQGLLAVAAVVAAATVVSMKIYKAYFSKAAKSCNKFKGDEKKKCMKKFKVDAIKQQIASLNSSKSKCKNTKDPKMCVSKIDIKIAKAKQKLVGQE